MAENVKDEEDEENVENKEDEKVNMEVELLE